MKLLQYGFLCIILFVFINNGVTQDFSILGAKLRGN